MAITPPITRTQPQVTQLEVMFPGPLVKNSIVEFFTDLLTLNVKYNYPHKRIWVKEFKTNFYLDNGDGSNASNWKKSTARVAITVYDPTTTYLAGDTVYQTGKIYAAKIDVPVNKNPTDFENYWLVISGGTETYRYLFSNASSILIYTEIRNPKFEIILGDFVTDGGGNIVFDSVTGLASLINKEIVEASVVQREDLASNNGIPYEVIFYEDSTVSTQVSGCVNIK